MEELFKALANLPKTQPKKYFMKTKGTHITWIGRQKEADTVEIDLPTFVRLQRGGIDNFTCDENNKILAKKYNSKTQYLMLVQEEKGASFVGDNPFWIKDQSNKEDRKFVWKAK